MKYLNLVTLKGTAFLLLLITFFSGCLKEGEQIKNPLAPRLVVIPSATEIKAGDKIRFDVLLFGEKIDDATLFIAEEEISGDEHVFKEEGVYKVYAQKDGIENSEIVKIKVGEGVNKLSLTVSETEILVGDSITFTALDGKDTIKADIYLDNHKIPANKILFDEEGVFKAYAQKEGYRNSDTLKITVTALPRLYIKASETDVVKETDVFFTVYQKSNGDSVEVEDALVYVGDEYIEDTEYKYFFSGAGAFNVYAQKEGYRNSDTLKIIVTALPKLYIKASETEIVEETDIFFTVYQKSNGDSVEVDDALVYVGDEYIEDTEYKYFFSEAGTFKVYAQKTGFENSDTIEVKVSKEKLPKLSLSIQRREVEVGQYVSLSPMYIQDGMGRQVRDAEVFVNGELVQVTMEGGFPFMWRSEEPGTFEAYAQKDGYENSDTIEITVIEKVIQPQMIVTPSNTEVTEGTTVSFEVKVFVDNGPVIVPSAAFILDIDGRVVNIDTYTFENVGVYTVIAKSRTAGGYQDSDPVTITVTANQFSANVYVSGFEGDGTSSQALLWEGNATQTTVLGNGMATDVFNFHGAYVSGHEFNSSGTSIKAKYWDSFQQEVILENGISQANSIMVESGDGGVVVGGSIGSDAVYWMWEQAEIKGYGQMVINDMIWDGNLGEYGVGNQINDGSSFAQIWAFGDRWGLHYDSRSYANAIAVDNEGDYFVAGAIEENYITTATLFGSQGSQPLSVPGAIYSMANDLVLQGNDLYIVGDYQDGSEWDYAVVWIDETMYKLNGNDKRGGANSVAVDTDGTVYVAGWTSETSFSNKVATYWVVDPSGNVTHTVELTDGTKNAEATGIVMGL